MGLRAYAASIHGGISVGSLSIDIIEQPQYLLSTVTQFVAL